MNRIDYIGLTRHGLTCIKEVEPVKNGKRIRRRILLRCKCGFEAIQRSEEFMRKNRRLGCKSCSGKKAIISAKNCPVGTKIGKLTLLSFCEQKKNNHKQCLVKCDCGTTKQIGFFEFHSKKTLSCGCLKLDKYRNARFKSVIIRYLKDGYSIKQIATMSKSDIIRVKEIVDNAKVKK